MRQLGSWSRWPSEWLGSRRQPRSSLHIPVLGEEVVQHSQRGLQVTVDNVFWPRFRLFQPSILHEFKGKGNIQDLLFKAVWGQEEAVQGYKVALQEPHEQHQVDPICKLHREPGVSMNFLHQSGINPPKATSEGRLMVRESHKGQVAGVGEGSTGEAMWKLPLCHLAWSSA